MQNQYCQACKGAKAEPVKMECCSKIICKKCYEISRKKKDGIFICQFCQFPLPMCQTVVQNQQMACRYECGVILKPVDYDKHVFMQCPKLKIKCRWCADFLSRPDYIHHVATTHSKDFQMFLVEELPNVVRTNKILDQTYNFRAATLDIKLSYKNDRGFESKRGTTGKLYCGQSLIVTGCNCDGYCGPNNGCSCASCMKLELETMGASNLGCLINGSGRLSRIGSNGRPFCGIRLNYNTDNYCNWEQNICSQCRYLEAHRMQQRYADLLKNLPKLPLKAHYVGDLFE